MGDLPAILCLHGSRQVGEVFSQRLKTLRKKLQGTAELEFMDAPVEMPLEEGHDVPMRTWWAPADGVEDYAAGVKAAIALVKERLREKKYVGVLGFSQGAALGVYLFRALAERELPELKFGIFAGGRVRQHASLNTIAATHPRVVHTLHFAGVRDPLVTVQDSRRAAGLFPKGAKTQFVEHDAGHVVPQGAECIATIKQFLVPFLQAARHEAQGYPLSEDVVEELETLAMLYGDDMACRPLKDAAGAVIETLPEWRDAVDAGTPARYEAPPSCAIRMEEHEATVVLSFLPGYPCSVPIKVEFAFDPLEAGVPPPPARPNRAWLMWAAKELAAVAEENEGEPQVFATLERVKELLEAGNEGVPEAEPAAPAHSDPNASPPPAGPAAGPTPLTESEDERAANARIATEHAAGLTVSEADWAEAYGKAGRFRYTIGLVGKPSAGKSTLFNAATQDATAARVAAFPFTTIEPNVGDALCTIPCPCQDPANGVAPKDCGASHGHAVNGERFFPVTVRDVAGLVPGAYQGRGKGNRFLDDLNDADVLVHVVDASGLTDAEGQAKEGVESSTEDALEEVRWVRREIHQWIYTNVARKWEAITRRPQKLPIMFSGYHAFEAMVHLAARKVGIDAKQMEAPRTWTALMLHKLVAGFIRVRFPVVVAMNKCDVPAAKANVDAVRAAFPNETVRAISAHVETTLIQLRHKGVVDYQVGGRVHVRAGQEAQYPTAVAGYLAAHEHSSGVANVLSTAITLRPTIRCFPVVEPATLASYGGGVLAHCFHLTPGSTPFDLYRVLTHGHFVDGDFVRSTIVDPALRQESILKKDQTLPPNTLPRIMTNKKSKWQQDHCKRV